ncbi:DUF726 domain-containing protein [Pseudomonas stutzeri]|uniref:DUF726 domain-containing protein n=1 Tax=Stutzerimonas stutzeri TaxID=316 RepID=UPI00030FC7AF|nr:DUF726 domain-containing protein [Stutzerimonas stutzeri]MBO0643632.1 DUF726 domain-containing protein [Stutzerimonas stutzeri]
MKEKGSQSEGLKQQYFKFSTLRNSESTEANIFIHGYSAGHDIEDRQMLANSIPPELYGQLNIFAFWQSGHFLRVNGRAKKLIAGTSRYHLAASAFVFAADRAMNFTLIRSRAEKMGSLLFEQLRDYLQAQHPGVTRINLVGHSLGGRVAVTALRSLPMKKDQRGPSIGNVVLMGAAVEVCASDAFAMFQRIDGRLINAYSTSDKILLLNADEKCLGRNEACYFSNIHMKGYGHTDYWPKLGEVLRKAKFSTLTDTGIGLATLEEDDFSKSDIHVYQVLKHSDSTLLAAAVLHLKSSSWTSIREAERDLALAFTRELQLVAGHFLANLLRGKGLRYAKILGLLAEHYGLGRELHDCAKISEYERLLLRQVFLQNFPRGNPLADSTHLKIEAIPQSNYLALIDELAKRLTLGSYFHYNGETVSTAGTGDPAVMPGPSVAKTYFRSAIDMIRNVEAESSRLMTNLKTALMPGFSALIPAIAIIHYARLQLNDEDLM